MDFKKLVFNGFFIPGVVIELLLILGAVLLESINSLDEISFLKRHIAGPKGITVGLLYLPYQLLATCFFLVAIFNSIRLPILYKGGSDKFIKTTRNFLNYGNFTLLAILIPSLIQFSSLSTHDIESYINLPVVISVFGFGLLMCGFFIFWTVKTYKHEGLKFFSKETLQGLGLSIAIIVGFTLSIIAFFCLACIITD
jgi:hypothetical protein